MGIGEVPHVVLEVQLAAVVAVEPAVQAAVEASLQEVLGGQHADRQRPLAAVGERQLELRRFHRLAVRVVEPARFMPHVDELVAARDLAAGGEHLFARQVDLLAGRALLEEDVQPAVGELSGGPAVEERRVVGERRRRLVGAHLGAHAPRVVALAHPGGAVDLDAPAVEFEPAAVAPELLRACHVLGDAAVAAAQMGLFLVRVQAADELDLEADARVVRAEREPMTAQAFDDLDGQRADRGRQRVGTQPTRGAEVPLPARHGNAGERIHHVAVGVVAEADVEDQVARGRRVAGVPEPLHPRRIAVVDLVEGGGQLVADQVVLGRQHGLGEF